MDNISPEWVLYEGREITAVVGGLSVNIRFVPVSNQELTNLPRFLFRQANDHDHENNKGIHSIPIILTKEYKRTSDECCIYYENITKNDSYRLCTNDKEQHTITWNRGYSKNKCPVCTLPLIDVEYINGEDPVNIEMKDVR